MSREVDPSRTEELAALRRRVDALERLSGRSVVAMVTVSEALHDLASSLAAPPDPARAEAVRVALAGVEGEVQKIVRTLEQVAAGE